MADGLNEARATRVLQLLLDFRTLEHQIRQLEIRALSTPIPNRSAGAAGSSGNGGNGYAVLRACTAGAQALLSSSNLSANAVVSDAQSGNHGEREKAELRRCFFICCGLYTSTSEYAILFTIIRSFYTIRATDSRYQYRIILDACARRFRAQKLYLRAQAAARWIANVAHADAAYAGDWMVADQVLNANLATITDNAVYAMLREYDRRAGRWCGEDPAFSLIVAWRG
ncbi:MAG: hypothetical protein M1819_003540 [Sarea resinae]|nr:MAG: hypothetical protein M1819_003540 [Sarea resinae]